RVVGGNEHLREGGGLPRAVVDTPDHRLPAEIEERLAGQPRRRVAGRNNADGLHAPSAFRMRAISELVERPSMSGRITTRPPPRPPARRPAPGPPGGSAGGRRAADRSSRW